MTNSTSVSLFIPDLSIGGAERVFVNLANGLADENLDVELVLLHKQGGFLSYVSNDVEVIELGASRLRYAIPSLSNHIQSKNVSNLITGMTFPNCVTILSKALVRVKKSVNVIITEHNTQSEKNDVGTKVQLSIARILYRGADQVIAVSEGVAEDVSEWCNLHKDSIQTIYNPIVNESTIFEDFPMPDHHAYSTNKDILLGVGRLVEQKNFPLLLEAFNRIESDRDVELVILGEGPKRSELEQKAEDLDCSSVIHFPGFVDDPYPYFAHSDVFVLSSKWEGFGNVLVEAMACGTPVVSTNCPNGPSEILADGEYGTLVPIGQPDTMAVSIQKELVDPISKTKLQNRALDFSVSKISKQYMEYLK
ncbi:glycosyltransferase [Natrialbaceae archaeon A-CW3]